MKQIRVDYFEVKIEDEGGNERVNAKFTNFQDAKKAVEHAKSLSLYHYGDPPQKFENIVIYESFQEYVEADRASLKKSALEKLSKAERMALGL